MSLQNRILSLQTAKKLMKDTHQVIVKCILHRSKSIGLLNRSQNTSKKKTKDILLSLARERNNSVATSLLHFEKEVQLVKYHGVFKYAKISFPSFFQGVKDKLFYYHSGSVPLKNQEEASKPPVPKTSNSKTKYSMKESSNNKKVYDNPIVAFMITSTQKLELKELGFSSSDIKSMKPIDAYMILSHGIFPQEVAKRLPEIMQDYHKQIASNSSSDSEKEAQEQQDKKGEKDMTNNSQTIETQSTSLAKAQKEKEEDRSALSSSSALTITTKQ